MTLNEAINLNNKRMVSERNVSIMAHECSGTLRHNQLVNEPT